MAGHEQSVLLPEFAAATAGDGLESVAGGDLFVPETPGRRPAPRDNRPQRCQVEMRIESLDQRLEPDDNARLVWKLARQ